MGSAFVEMTLDGALTRSQVRAAFDGARDRSLVERGNLYSGDWGCIDDLIFDDSGPVRRRSEIEEDLYHEIEKRSAVATLVIDDKVRVRDHGKEYEDAGKRLDAVEKILGAFAGEVIARVRTGTSKTRGCAACGSSISVAHMRPSRGTGFRSEVGCPVCGAADYIATAAEVKRRDGLVAEAEALVARMTAIRSEAAAKNARKVWLILGVAPS